MEQQSDTSPVLTPNDIEQLLNAAESGEESSILAVMGANSNLRIGQDIPVAAEMLGLLRHFLSKLPFRPFNDGSVALDAGIHCDLSARLIALIPIGANELEVIAYWLSQGLNSSKVTALPGLLALPFSIEQHDDRRWLMPEWYAMFYVDGTVEHSIPVLTLQSVLDDGRFSDWVPVALERAEAFGLPIGQAKQEAQRVVIQKAE